MKKIIVTLCSLALSIAGTFGANQLASKDQATIDNNKEQVTYEQEADVVEDAVNLTEDEIKTEERDLEEKKASELEVEAPKADNANKKEAKDNDKVENNTEVRREDKTEDKAERNQSVVDKDDKEPVTSTNNAANNNVNNNANNNIIKTKTNTNTNTNTNSNNVGQKNITDNINDFKSNGNNVYVYKGIDLSNCDSKQDVVKELQKNGYKNINMKNIQNIGSLEDILSLIGEKGSQGNTSDYAPTKPEPTTAPKQSTPTTTPKQSTPTTTPTNPSNNSYADEVLRLVNIEREKAGLSHLTTNSSLTAAANKRAQETKTSFSHTRPNGSKFSTVLQEYGVSYRTAGENIAYGQRSPQEVVSGWMNSPGHRANILNGSFNKIGIGVYQSGGVIYWSQLFTN